MRKTLEKHDIFILRRYLGTTRCHDGTQNFLKRKFDTSALKWRVTRAFWIAIVGGEYLNGQGSQNLKFIDEYLRYVYDWTFFGKYITLAL